MPKLTRQVSWGDALVVEQFKHPGGLKSAVEALHAEVGFHIGVRGTFQKFFKVTDPDTLQERDRFRVWLLLAAFGQDPSEWGVLDDVVPACFDPAALRERLAARRAELRAAEAAEDDAKVRAAAEKGLAMLAEREVAAGPASAEVSHAEERISNR